MTEVSATTLFDGGPPTRLQTALRLEKPGHPRVAQRAILVALIGWLPLAVFGLAQGQASGNATASLFFSDFATYARLLIAAPLLILAERDCLPKLGAVAAHFLDSGLVRDSERRRFAEAVSSTRRLLDSQSVEILVVILAYFASAAMLRFSSEADNPHWLKSGDDLTVHFSLAEGWYVFVSRPLFLILIFGWFWRQFLWVRFLWLMSALDLRLVPSHPDQVGGLRFISSSLRGYRLLCGSFGIVGAGITANRVVHENASPMVLKNAAIAIVAIILILFVAPLMMFLRKLRQTKKRGIFEYGALAGGVGLQFERKWLNNSKGIDGEALTAPDFSATTDMYSVAANAYGMKEVPFGLSNIGSLVLAALIPFVPIALLAVPLNVVLKELTKLVL